MSESENGKDEHAEAATLAGLKLAKSRNKAAYTRMRNRLYDLCDEEDVKKEELRDCLDKTEEALDNAIESVTNIVQFYKENKRTVEMNRSLEEITILEEKYEEVLKAYRSCSSSSEKSSVVAEDPVKVESDIGKDLWKQLKRVSIPIFDGDKRKYESWNAAFCACIDSAPATPQYKLLQLKQYLRGEALKCVEELGHSSEAYDIAKLALERKFGGSRRQCMKFIEDLENFKPIRNENAKEMERFADLLDITVLRLKDLESESDFGKSTFYFTLLKKMPQSMLTKYIRWIHNHCKEETIETLKEWVNLEAEFVMTAQETIHGISQLSTHSAKTFHTNLIMNETRKGQQKRRVCTMCNCEHDIWSCEHFLKLNVKERWRKAKELKLCFRCLRNNHIGNDCRSMKKCGIDHCNKTHHQLLHLRENTHRLNPEASSFKQRNEIIHPEAAMFGHQNEMRACAQKSSFIALRTVPVVLTNGRRKLKVNALLDDGSTQTYLNRNIAAELELLTEENMTKCDNVTVNLLNGKKEIITTQNVSFGIESCNGQLKMNISANTIDNVTGNLRAIELNEYTKKWDHLKGIEFPYVGPKASIDILIGLDYVELHQSLFEVQGEPGQPVARLTPLGWTCVGNLSTSETSNFHTFFLREENSAINETLRKFWEIEELGMNEEVYNQEDRKVLENTEKSIVYHEGRYEIGIPWKENKNNLSANKDMALKRLENTEKRLNRDNVLKETYANVIDTYVKKGYVSKIDKESDDENSQKWFLPHFPVVRPDRSTTKVRIVFDASARQKELSLNDVIYQGPKLQQNLLEVLLRFRKHSVAIACDIQEMYLQIGIPIPDRRFHRFLWRTSSKEEADEYEFNRVVFGINASPFLAQYISQYNAKKFSEIYPMASETILRATYMDDSLDSVATDIEGVQLYNDLTELWKKAGMLAHKWLSNSSAVLSEIPQEARMQNVDLSKGEMPVTKTLGVKWYAESDTFTFSYNVPSGEMPWTKRSFLKKMATIYDPLGLVTPYTIRAKILMQDMWMSGVNWDDSLNKELTDKASQWFSELSKIDNISVPRNLAVGELKLTELHTFVDASSMAYSSVVYIRNTTEDNKNSVNIVASKSKVAPLASISIPRLELMAAIQGLRLTRTVCRALDMSISEVIFWSDSLNVLWWIRNQSRKFKPFVAHRIGEIQSTTQPEQWRYVPTTQNPADCASRGLTIEKLCKSDIWWQGPQYLQEPKSSWPINKVEQGEEAKVEARSKFEGRNFYTVIQSDENDDNLNPERFSCLKRLVRIRAWVYRFIKNCQVPKNERILVKELIVEELNAAETQIVCKAQATLFEHEYMCLQKGRELPRTSKLVALNPFLDEEGVMRSNSRLKFAEYLPYDSRHPIILPRKSWVTKLVVRHYHALGGHCGTNQTLALLSARYWVLCAREEIREVEHECTECRRRKGKVVQQIMGPLPDSRLFKTVRAFNQVAVDYAGPFLTKVGRGKPRMKRYLCLFTCMVCRAVHLEMSYSLDTDSFLNTFYRFVSRRGLPELVISDNGTNFVGAVNELKDLHERLDKDKVTRVAANQGIKWKFNPPAAPNFGGVHESMVKTAKRAIFVILSKADINDEELQTAFVGAEGLINSRPLTYQSSNPADPTVLTPNHFLHGQIGGKFAPETVDATRFDIRKRWRLVQELMKHFWKRWFQEYLPTLGYRKKWHHKQPDYETGDVVLVIDPNTPRGQWNIGRVTKTYPGADHHVRVVDIQVGDKELRRATNRLCLLEKAS